MKKWIEPKIEEMDIKDTASLWDWIFDIFGPGNSDYGHGQGNGNGHGHGHGNGGKNEPEDIFDAASGVVND